MVALLLLSFNLVPVVFLGIGIGEFGLLWGWLREHLPTNFLTFLTS